MYQLLLLLTVFHYLALVPVRKLSSSLTMMPQASVLYMSSFKHVVNRVYKQDLSTLFRQLTVMAHWSAFALPT